MALGGALPLDAGAWGFGRAQTSAVLGLPLDFTVALRLEPGESPPECLTVDVTVGDIPLARSAVSAVLDTSAPSPVVRVRSLQAIDEPLVQVNLSAGCSSRVTRRFTLLADPPGHMASSALAQAEAVSAATAGAAAVVPATAPAPAAAASAPSPQAAAVSAGVPPPDVLGRAGAGGASSQAGAPAMKADAAQAASKRPQAPARQGADPGQLADAKATASEPKAPAAAARPRLQLETPTIASNMGGGAGTATKPAAVLAAEEAASAARAAASAAEARAAAMEKNIEALRQEAKANRESLARLTQALQDAPATPEVPLAMWGALAGLGALSALLLFRLRRQSSVSNQDAPWWSSGGSAAAAADELPDPSAPEPVASTLTSLTAGSAAALAAQASPAPGSDVTPDRRAEVTRLPAGASLGSALEAQASAQTLGLGYSEAAPARELPPLPDPEELDPVGDMDRTQLLPPSAASVSAPIQGISIEELLDLEQQVEFFTVLGQDDAALGLLVEHLRSTGGTYPLPYLKLLEIYRSKGDEDSYERTRDRFNQRFNAVVPAWGAPPPRDRHLEDLPEVLSRIEQVWRRPVDAMALLENMLVRTEGGTLLEMSALGEVLFLFTLARDMHEQEQGSADAVDVLLPFDDIFGDEPSRPAAQHDAPATQFAASSFAKMEPMAAVMGLAAAAAEPAVGDEVDHFDIPLGEPMFEPVFDLPLEGTGFVPATEPPGQAALAVSIDLPTFGSEPSAVGASTPAQEDSFLEPLSFDLPELEAIQEPLPSKADTASAVDLDISLDGLELEPVAAKLSPSQEQAASNSGLFIDTPSPGKPR